MNKSIEDIASVHLGKAGNGTKVEPYVTPKSIDSSLLVSIPRYLNRTQYQIIDTDLKFVGTDTWNCYEVSFLLANGMPVAGVVKLQYSADSYSIVESKSLKLYLNSFNMDRFGTVNKQEAEQNLVARIKKDLSDILGTYVIVSFYDGDNQYNYSDDFTQLEASVNYSELEFSHYNESPDTLLSSGNKVLKVKSSLLRSNCRVTNQPDWGDIYIYIRGDDVPTEESMLQYIVSLRSENHFHEEICECVYRRLQDKFVPTDLAVFCAYTRRGGIDINPMRASTIELGNMLFGRYTNIHTIYKTVRQ